MKKSKRSTPLIVVIVDSIENSVFAGQVLQPLLDLKEKNPTQDIVLISFENNPTKLISWHYPIKLIRYKRYPYSCTLSLLPSILLLRKFLNSFDFYHLQARGPIAGYIAYQSLNSILCTQFIIQARGLLAEEYCYAYQSEKNILKKIIHWWKERSYRNLEKQIYSYTKNYSFMYIQAVSKSLQNYIAKTYSIPLEKIAIATHDIPPIFDISIVRQWRNQGRKTLSICQDAIVYTYNGSAKPWQCPQEIFDFFRTCYTNNKKSVLLILSSDVDYFSSLRSLYNFDESIVKILYVPHTTIYQYLALANFGIIFRKPHSINWTCRPTKALEYHAVGLTIIHNNTIEELITGQYSTIQLNQLPL